MIEPIVMTQEFERIKQIDDYSSLIWTTRYYECGDFEIVLPVTAGGVLPCGASGRWEGV